MATQFQSPEHWMLGDAVTLKFPSGSAPGESTPLSRTGQPDDPYPLYYGQALALAGDFYAVLGQSIMGSQKNFAACFATLANAAPQELDGILAIMNDEARLMLTESRAGRDPSIKWEEKAKQFLVRYNAATGGSGTDYMPMGRMLKLAAENFDHFGLEAQQAYVAGHRLACAKAAQAAQVADPTAQEALLQQAYLMNAFADHFLTDLFASGHLRVPRRELAALTLDLPRATSLLSGVFGYPVTPKEAGPMVGNLLANCMHEEDGKSGLRVRSTDGSASWTAYGDSHLLDPKNSEGYAMAKEAVIASAQEVWTHGFAAPVSGSGSQDPPCRGLALSPDLSRIRTGEDQNPDALFVYDADLGVGVRKVLSDRTSHKWVFGGQWSAVSTLLQLKSGLTWDWLVYSWLS